MKYSLSNPDLSGCILYTIFIACFKSCFVDITLDTTSTAVSPCIDLQRASLFAVANRIDNIDDSSDVFPTTDFVAPTEPDGDNNSAIYLTKQITLENPATAIKVIHGAHRPSTSEIKMMFKSRFAFAISVSYI